MKIEKCPICGGKLKVSRLTCRSCKTSIEGDFITAPLLNLPASYQDVI